MFANTDIHAKPDSRLRGNDGMLFSQKIMSHTIE